MIEPAARRALIIVENCYGPRDTRVWSEALTLKQDGWDVAVICPESEASGAAPRWAFLPPAPTVVEGIAVYAFPLAFAERGIVDYLREYALASWHVAVGMARAWSARPADTVQFCNPPDSFFPLGFVSRLLGAAVVFDHHDLFPEVTQGRFDGWAGRVLYALARTFEYLTFRSASVVLSTNRSYERIAVTRGRMAPSRTFVVRNGPRLGQFTPVSPVPSLKQGYRYMACYVGMMGQQDGVLELIDVIREVVRGHGRRDVLFALLGDGAVRAEALARVRAWGLEEAVVAPGLVHDRLLLRQYLCTADVCLSPELSSPLNDRSTFIKVAEYMAMAKPVLAYDLAETRHTAAGAAVYVEPGNAARYAQALLDMLAQPEARDAMGRIARERVVGELAWEHQQATLLRAYEEAWRRSRRSRRHRSSAPGALEVRPRHVRGRFTKGSDRSR